MSLPSDIRHGGAVCIFTLFILLTDARDSICHQSLGVSLLNCPTSPAGEWHIPSVPLSRQSLSQSGSMFSCRYQHTSHWDSTPTTLHQFKGHESLRLDPLFTNPHTTWYILSPTSLFAALKKSDKEASQLAPSVPLLSYRREAGCAGLKGSHWWAVLYRTKALLSDWRGPLQDDFWWITAVTVHSAFSFLFLEPFLFFKFFSFMMSPLSPVSPKISLFPFFPPSIVPFFFVSFVTFFCCLSLNVSIQSFYTWLFLSQFISLCPWINYWFNQATLDKMSSRVPHEFTQVQDFLQLSVLIWALWDPRDLLSIKQRGKHMACSLDSEVSFLSLVSHNGHHCSWYSNTFVYSKQTS